MSVTIPNYIHDRPASVTHPLGIMREAADKLGESTQGKVTGNIFTMNPGGTNLFRYTFYLVAPSLNDYSDALFYAWHDLRPYPITVLRAGGKQGKDEQSYQGSAEFETALGEIFSSDAARQRIYVLLDAIEATSSRRS